MIKRILKTALITALSFIGVLVIGAFSIFTFAPSLSASVCHDLGMRKLASSCLERVYKNTGEIDDLIEVIDSAVYAENKQTVAEYGKVLFYSFNDTANFKSICAKGDEDIKEGEYSTYDYYASTVFMALYETGDKQGASEFAIKFMGDEYTEKCVLKMAVKIANPETDKAFGDMLVNSYKNDKTISKTNYKKFEEEMKAYGDAYKF